jgi:hypothetical protein
MRTLWQRGERRQCGPENGIPRDELFITTSFMPRRSGSEPAGVGSPVGSLKSGVNSAKAGTVDEPGTGIRFDRFTVQSRPVCGRKRACGGLL